MLNGNGTAHGNSSPLHTNGEDDGQQTSLRCTVDQLDRHVPSRPVDDLLDP